MSFVARMKLHIKLLQSAGAGVGIFFCQTPALTVTQFVHYCQNQNKANTFAKKD